MRLLLHRLDKAEAPISSPIRGDWLLARNMSFRTTNPTKVASKSNSSQNKRRRAAQTSHEHEIPNVVLMVLNACHRRKRGRSGRNGGETSQHSADARPATPHPGQGTNWHSKNCPSHPLGLVQCNQTRLYLPDCPAAPNPRQMRNRLVL